MCFNKQTCRCSVDANLAEENLFHGRVKGDISGKPFVSWKGSSGRSGTRHVHLENEKHMQTGNNWKIVKVQMELNSKKNFRGADAYQLYA